MMLVIACGLFATLAFGLRQEHPIRQTVNGQVRGLIHKSLATKKDVEIFYGIPYAKPPVRKLRFENPEDPDDWAPDVRSATTFHALCYQYNSDQKYVDFHRLNTPGENEDCLYLNIFVPAPIISTKKAVLVYIHGGSNVLGSAHMFDGDELASYGDIIVVTVNYRLGVLGFLGSGEDDFRGNYALRDQIKALEWVRDNIANFGGDPSMVTLVGHSSAAWNVGRHLTSPLAEEIAHVADIVSGYTMHIHSAFISATARQCAADQRLEADAYFHVGLFRAAVSVGGSPTLKAAFRDPHNEILNMAYQMNCPIGSSKTMKECLKTKPAKELSKWFSFQHKYLPFAVLPDDTFFAIQPNAVFNAQHYLLSYTTDEAYTFVSQLKEWSEILDYLKQLGLLRSDVDVSDVIEFEYTDRRTSGNMDSRMHSFSNCLSDAFVKVPSVHAANVLTQAGLDVFLYEWSHTAPSLRRGSRSVSPHGIDLHYLFGDPFSTHHYYNFMDIDREMSKALMETMGNYVRNLIFAPNANLTLGSRWKYNSGKTFLRFVGGNPAIQVRKYPVPRAVEFWENYLPCLSEKLMQKTCS